MAGVVAVNGTLEGNTVRAEILGPNEVAGNPDLLAKAAQAIEQGERVYLHPYGGGTASFEDPLIAAVTLAGQLENVTIEGLDVEDPDRPAAAVDS